MSRRRILWIILLCMGGLVNGLLLKPGDEKLLECIYDPNEYRVGQTIMRFWVRDNGTGVSHAISMNNKVLTKGYEMNIDMYYGEYNLYIESASLQIHNGTFRCHVEDREDNTKTRVRSEIPLIILNKPGPPVIYPKSPTVRQDQFIEVNCSTVGGNPLPTIQWLNEDKSVVESRENESFTTKTVVNKNIVDPSKTVHTSILKICGDREDHGRILVCAVSNAAMEKNKTIEAKMEISVEYLPKIFLTPFSHFKVEEDSNVSITSSVNANPPIHSFFWSFQGDLLGRAKKLHLYNVKATDSGIYMAHAKSTLGESSSSTYMEVLHRPIHNHSSEVKVKEGSHVSIDCSPTSCPPQLSTMWYKYGNSSFRQNGTVLRLKSVKRADQGMYACESRSLLKLSVLGTRYEKEEERTMRTNLSLIVTKAEKIRPSSTTTSLVTDASLAKTEQPTVARLQQVVFEKKSKVLKFRIEDGPPLIKVYVLYQGEKEWEYFETILVFGSEFSKALFPVNYRPTNRTKDDPIRSVKVQACQRTGPFCGKNYTAQLYEEKNQQKGAYRPHSTFLVVTIITIVSVLGCFYSIFYFYMKKQTQILNANSKDPSPAPEEENPNTIQSASFQVENQNLEQGDISNAKLRLATIYRTQRRRFESILV